MNWRDFPDAPVAVHEAGHVVVGYALNLIPCWASIRRKDDRLGVTYCHLADQFPDGVVMRLAAGVAERRFAGRQSEGDSRDREKAWGAISKHAADPSKTMIECQRLAEQLVDRYWPAILQVAERLCKAGELAGDEFKNVMANAMPER